MAVPGVVMVDKTNYTVPDDLSLQTFLQSLQNNSLPSTYGVLPGQTVTDFGQTVTVQVAGADGILAQFQLVGVDASLSTTTAFSTEFVGYTIIKETRNATNSSTAGRIYFARI